MEIQSPVDPKVGIPTKNMAKNITRVETIDSPTLASSGS